MEIAFSPPLEMCRKTFPFFFRLREKILISGFEKQGSLWMWRDLVLSIVQASAGLQQDLKDSRQGIGEMGLAWRGKTSGFLG